MNGSTASAFVKPSREESGSRRDLIVSVNWIGDAIMAMPAIQLYRRLHPGIHITMLARGMIADLWALHQAPDDILRYDQRPALNDPLFDTLRNQRFDAAWILPNSFRSGWMVFRAGIPVRTGMKGGIRQLLLSDVRTCHPHPYQKHQAWEYIHLLNPEMSIDSIPHPELRIPTEVRDRAAEKFGRWSGPAVGLIPGAARGPSKRWPAKHFTVMAKRIMREGYHVVLFGGPDDAGLCDAMAAELGSGAVNLAGKTNLAEWASLMGSCRLVIANDSGGMHLAAALGRPVIALYGMTDPGRTGPLGDECVILQNSRHRSRDISRNSAEAQKCLAAIRPETVYEAFQALIRSSAITQPEAT